jgi:hypothetical protein
MYKKFLFLTPFVLALSLVSISYGASDPCMIKLDFNVQADNNDANTEPGFTGFTLQNSGMEVNGVVVDIGATVGTARRTEPCGTYEYGPYMPIAGEKLYRDLLYGIYPNGITITLWNLGANRDCNITIYAFDAPIVDGNRVADWNANDVNFVQTWFKGGTPNWPEYEDPEHPEYADKWAFRGRATADGNGTIVLTSFRDPCSYPRNQPFAYANGIIVEPNVLVPYLPPKYPTRPQPANGATNVDVNVVLSWRKSPLAEKRDVYFDTNSALVTAASDPNTPPGKGRQDANTYNPSPDPCYLALSTTYYWKISEVNTTPPPTTYWTGEVWHFTTGPNSLVENFNEYPSTDDLRAKWTYWKTNETGSTISIVLGIEDANFVRGGRTSNAMEFDYDNSDPTYLYYSESYVDIGTAAEKLNIDPNWIAMNAKSLVLYFRGTATNDANRPMYVSLTDGGGRSAKVVYDGLASNLRDPSWHEWNIKLQDFVDNNNVNLGNVSRITLGIGNGIQAGIGTVYFEDIYLYATRCVLVKRDANFAKLDFAPSAVVPGDCKIDLLEIATIRDGWLTRDATANTSPPGDTNLTAWYRMNEGGDANTTINSAPNADPCSLGYLSPKKGDTRERPITWTDPPGVIIEGVGGPGGPDPNYALHFDGQINKRLSCGKWDCLHRGPGDQNDMTVAIWVKWLGDTGREKSQGLISKRGGWTAGGGANGAFFMFEVDTTPSPRGTFALRQYDSYYGVWAPANRLNPFIGKWVHLAATFDQNATTDPNGFNTGIAHLYLNGAEVPASGPDGVPTGRFAMGQGDPCMIELTIGQISDVNEQGTEAFFGDLDEARIYNRALTPAQVAYLADTSPGDGLLQIPVPSNAEVWTGEQVGNRKVNFKDFDMVADPNFWLKQEMWP